MAVFITQTSLEAFADAVLDKNGSAAAKEDADAGFGGMAGAPAAQPVAALGR